MNWVDWLQFFMLSLVWGSAFVAIRLGVAGESALVFVAIRIGISIIPMAVLYFIKRKAIKLMLPVKQSLIFLLLGLINIVLPFLMISWASKHLEAGLISFVNTLIPLFTLLFSLVLGAREKLTWLGFSGIFISLAGVAVLTSGTWGSGKPVHLLALAAVIGAPMLYGLSNVLIKKYTRGVDSLVQSLYQTLAAIIFLWLLVAFFAKPADFNLSAQAWLTIIWLGAFVSFLGSLFFFKLHNRVGALKTSLISYLIPLVTTLMGMVFLK